MADAMLKEKVRDILRNTSFGGPDDAVDVPDSEEADDFIHVVVISPKLAGKRLAEKTDLILSPLSGSLPPGDWGRVTLSVGLSPDELKSL